MSKNVVTLKSGSEVTQGHRKCYQSIDRAWFPISVYSNFVPKTHRFWDIRLVSILWPWNPGWGSLKVIENYPIHSGTHDFLLTFHGNHRPISHRFRERKSPIFPPPVYLTHPLKFCIGAGVSMGLSGDRKSFQIGLAVLIQYRSVAATQPPSQPATLP